MNNKKNASELAFVPNAVPFKVRLLNIMLSVILLIYGTFGVITDNFVIPGKRGELTLYGYPAWVMYGALLCLVANLIATVIDHYDARNNEKKYKKFEAFARKSGCALFVLALMLALVKHSKDFVCEDRVVLKATNEEMGLTAFAYNRYCALHNPLNAVEPLLQVTVIPVAAPLPVKFRIAAHMNRTEIVRMYWNGKKLVLEYRPRQAEKTKGALPEVNSDTPVPVELIKMNPGPVAEGRSTIQPHRSPHPERYRMTASGRFLPVTNGCYGARLCENACTVLKSALLRKICQRLVSQ